MPKGFTRLRHYGILSSSWKKEKLAKLQEALGLKKEKQEEGESIVFQRRCPSCKVGELETILTFNSRGL